MATNPIVTSLPSYVEEHNLPLIAKSVLGAKTAKLFSLQSGVKGPSALNLVSTDVTFQDASECGWNAVGETKLTQRILTPAYLKVNHSFCDKNLLKTWAQYEVKVAAGEKTLPFEEDFVNGIISSVDEKVEKMIWQGAKDSTTEFEGIIPILNDASDVVKVAETAGTTAYKAIKDVYLAMPEAVVSKDDAVIFVSAGIFRQFIQDLVDANQYHWTPSDVEGEYMLPGTNCKVIAVNGLNDTATSDYIIAGRLSNFYYGTDLMGDEEKFDLFYSKDNQEFRLVIEFTAGVQVAYPNEIVMGTVAK